MNISRVLTVLWLPVLLGAVAQVARCETQSAATAPSSTSATSSAASEAGVFFDEAAKPLSGRLLVSVRTGNGESIVVVDLDRKVAITVAQERSQNLQPRWSPDGTEIMFAAERSGSRKIVRADWDGSNQRLVMPDQSNSQESPDWNSDGSLMTFISGGHSIISIGLESKIQNTLIPPSNRRIFNQRLSPDARQVAYNSDANWPGADLCLWLIPKSSSRCPLAGSARYGRPAWHPEGKRIAFSVEQDDQSSVGVLELESGRVTPVKSIEGQEREPCWSPDGSHLLLASIASDPERSKIWITDLINDPQMALSLPGSIHSMQWSGRKTMEVEAMRVKRMGGGTR